jgi:Leucine-rich repeat (LRR) protein
MEHLNLSSNGFTGSVPLAIAGFPKLKSLVLDTNSFNGSYPGAEIGNLLTQLETLTLASNPFAPGPIPEEFSKLKKLKMLWMSGMNLTGGIADKLSSLTELTLLAMYDNNLQGEIPAWVWNLQKLEILYLYGNSFTGAIGTDITAVSIQEIDLSENYLTGPIPESIGNLKNLWLLYLYLNNLTGPIPSSVGRLPNLADIRLFSNRLSGPLPPELGKHSPLGNLEVSNNFLSGELPDTLCFNKQLYDIVVFNNSFSGAFPAILGDCETVNNIMLYNNHFNGEFPGTVWSAFPTLTTVMIQNNNFTGVLPAEVSSNITRIEIGNNRFSGAIPTSATGLKTFMAENNWFSHGLPEDMTKLANLIDLSLAGNQIGGFIPVSIRALEMLNYLNLSGNQITGAIPEAAIGLLPVLTILDLSNNKLDADIPEDFNNLHLNYLNLSSNQLVGEVPAALQSPVFYAAFFGNTGLCARQDAGMPLPTCDQGGGRSSARMIIILTATISSISGISFVAVMGWFVLRRKSNSRDVTSWKMIPFGTLNFGAQDIISNISEGNLIGRGGSGKVYRIHLGSHKARGHHGGDGGAGHSTSTTVAVKKIGNDDGKPGANDDKEFEAEARSLGGLLHGNIVRLLCCISGGDANTKLLVYEYMENGSLDRWLNRRHGGKRAAALDWPTRLSIGIDVARGLSYMHHGFTSPVIHRDIKCSNILLDRGFRAKIADFGLARILAKSGESEPVSAVCGTFGYIAPGVCQDIGRLRLSMCDLCKNVHDLRLFGCRVC